jgi:predicted helicase
VVKNTYEKFADQQGVWESYVTEHLIPRLNGFEILMASYTMAHLNLDMLLKKTGYKRDGNERLQIYLTNSLAGDKAQMPQIGFIEWLINEANGANRIKRDVPVMVVLGNPPYSGISQNMGTWINDLVETYKYVNGVHFNERKHWLQDDYVKFIRYGQHFIEKNGEGILAYINNHSFLDNPTFRGMRWNLLKTFDKIYILDLHGNAKKKEKTPDGSKDENVFDIQQGVSINIFVKTRNAVGAGLKPAPTTKPASATVYHADLYGKRSEKFSFLNDNNLKTVQWQQLEVKEPFYFFVPKSEENKAEYEKGFTMNELFKVNVTGIVTARDAAAIDFDEKTLLNKIEKFCNAKYSDEDIRRWLFPNKADGKYLAGDSRGWNLSDARRKIRDNAHKEYVVEINERPLDIRKIYYTPDMVDWGREKIMQHFINGENLGLIIGRQGHVVGSMPWNLTFVTKQIVDINIYYRGGGLAFPLYIYIKNGVADDDKRPYHKHHNLNETIINEISKRLGLPFADDPVGAYCIRPCETNINNVDINNVGVCNVGVCNTPLQFAPIDVLDYIYAVLHSPSYREKYKEFLKIDFPRVPYPENAKQFWNLVELGGKLRQLHLLEGVEPQKNIANFPIAGNNEVEKTGYIVETHCNASLPNGRVYINDTQYFDNIPVTVWNFYIGGYQPAQKWLKDRKGRTLNYEDIRHYQKMIVALKETDEIMNEIEL